MQRWIPVLAIVLVLQLALAIILGLRANPLAAQEPDTPLVKANLAGADRLLVRGPAPAESGKAAQVELVKKDGAWTLPGYFDAPASASKVKVLLDRLAQVRRGFPIATTEDALKRFKVAADTYERHLVVSQGGKTLASVYLGSSPGLRKVDARTADDQAVYAVGLATYEMPDRASDWLDPDLLKRDPDQLASVAVNWPGGASLKLVRQNTKGDEPMPAWKAEGLAAGENLEPTRAEALVRAIAGVRVDGVFGTQAKPEWQQGRPELSLTLVTKDGKRTSWTLFKPKTGDSHVLKSSDRSWYLELKSWSAKPLLDAAVRDKLVVPEKPATASAGTAAPATTGAPAPAGTAPAAQPQGPAGKSPQGMSAPPAKAPPVTQSSPAQQPAPATGSATPAPSK